MFCRAIFNLKAPGLNDCKWVRIDLILTHLRSSNRGSFQIKNRAQNFPYRVLMPLYQYNALDNQRRKRTGLIEAQGEKEAKEKLRDQGLMVINLGVKTSASSRENLRGENLVTFTIQLSQLINAGLPLYQSLNALEEQYRTEPFHRVLLSLCEQIRAGNTLSQAMAGFPGSFDHLYCAMISAGESAGALNIVLQRLSLLLQKQMKLRSQIISALIYPAVLGSFCLLIVMLLLGFVIPSVEGMFEGRTLNGFTQAVLNVSHFLRGYWWIYLPIIGGIVVFFIYKSRTVSGKIWMQRNFLKLPLVRTIMIKAAVARFCRTMGTLQQGGLPIIDSLQISREVIRNVVLEEEIKKAEGKIIEGSSLSAELGRSKWMPLMVSRMLAVGEESGTIMIMLNQIADMYENDLEKTIERFLALLQPGILILMGSIIVTIMLAVLLPLMDISAFTSS